MKKILLFILSLSYLIGQAQTRRTSVESDDILAKKTFLLNGLPFDTAGKKNNSLWAYDSISKRFKLVPASGGFMPAGSGTQLITGDGNYIARSGAAVGLNLVDNTSDINKPVSTAQQSALNLKQSISEKGAANGYAPLNGTGRVPISNIASGTPDGTKFVADDGTLKPVPGGYTPPGDNTKILDGTGAAISPASLPVSSSTQTQITTQIRDSLFNLNNAHPAYLRNAWNSPLYQDGDTTRFDKEKSGAVTDVRINSGNIEAKVLGSWLNKGALPAGSSIWNIDGSNNINYTAGNVSIGTAYTRAGYGLFVNHPALHFNYSTWEVIPSNQYVGVTNLGTGGYTAGANDFLGNVNGTFSVIYGATGSTADFVNYGQRGMRDRFKINYLGNTTTYSPLYFKNASLLGTKVDGAIEYDGTHFYGTVGANRYQFDQQSSGGISAITGDIIASGTGSVSATIAANAVDFTKFTKLNSGYIVGRSTAGLGNAEAIQIGSGLDMSAGILRSAETLNSVLANGNVSTADIYVGSLQTTKLQGGVYSMSGGIGTTAPGSGATSTRNGNDIAGRLTITTGTSPGASARLIVLTYRNAYSSTPRVIITPANAAAAALTGSQAVYVDDATNSTTSFEIFAGSTPLAASTTYIWYYHVIL